GACGRIRGKREAGRGKSKARLGGVSVTLPFSLLPLPALFVFMPEITRRQTVTTLVGGVPVGSCHPIVVQSMTNTDTADVAGTVKQVAALARAGSELVRVTVNTDEAAAAIPPVVEQLEAQGVRVPIIGDFHYNGHLLLRKFPGCAE